MTLAAAPVLALWAKRDDLENWYDVIDIWQEWATGEQTARFERPAGDLGPIYGYLWRSFGGDYPEMNGVDQIARLIKEIETNPNSRRLIVSGWDPRECDNVDLPPCHTLFQFKIENRHADRTQQNRHFLRPPVEFGHVGRRIAEIGAHPARQQRPIDLADRRPG